MNYRKNDKGVAFAHKPVKLSEAQVIAIYSHPKNDTNTAIDFGVSQTTITAIRSGKTWRYLYERIILGLENNVVYGARGKRPFDDRYMPEPNTGCWLWIGATDSDGYGITAGGMKAHRESYVRHVGKIGRLCVLHKCDTPRCVNPAHLYAGTNKQNAYDRKARGRGAKGEKSPNAKLNDVIVRSIRSDTRPVSAIAMEYGVTPRVIYLVKARVAWGHVA